MKTYRNWRFTKFRTAQHLLLKRTAFALSLLATVATFHASTAHAADVEAFEATATISGRPNVLFVLDSTDTLATSITRPSFDGATTYSNAADCDPTYAYFSTAGGKPASCKTGKTIGKVRIVDLKCDSATLDRLATLGATQSASDPVTEQRKWLEKRPGKKSGTFTYEPLSAPGPTAGNSIFCSTYTGGDAPPAANFSSLTPITLWAGNYLNYEEWVKTAPVVLGDSRMDKVKKALEYIARKYYKEINMGLMRTATSASSSKGGPVVFEVSSGDGPAQYKTYHGKDTRLDDFIWTLYDRVACKSDENCGGAPPPVTDCKPFSPDADCVQVMTPNGAKKPLTEALYEATMYFKGSSVDFGANALIDPTIKFSSVPGSIANYEDCRSGSGGLGGTCVYKSPIGEECQRNYVVFLTDGLSEGDVSRDSAITALLESLDPDVREAGGYSRSGPISTTACDATGTDWSASGKAPGTCFDDLSYYLRNGVNVETFAVGFQLSASDAETEATKLLNDVAEAGGTGKAYLAEDPEGLNLIIDAVVSKILTSNTSFSAPSVTINAFNRTQNLNDLYMAVFATEFTRKWEGNVKKYSIRPSDGQIIDYREEVAVDAVRGFFKEDSQSIWYKAADGTLAPVGGAAAKLPDPAADADDGDRRTIYTDDADDLVDLREYSVDLASSNIAAAKTLFGLEAFADGVAGEEVSTLVEWLYGVDTYDEYPARIDTNGERVDGNGDTAERKRLMGDPLHSRPAVVVYGNKTLADGKPDPNDAVVYITTNEGLLHAIDSQTGVEKWAFAPKELLYRLDLLRDFSSKTELKDRTNPYYYGLDGTVRVLRIDRDSDGPIDSSKGDRVFLYFGMRRGGSAYYAIDVTKPDSPNFMWRFELPDGAESWSNPTVGSDIRVNIDGATYGSHGASYGSFDNDDAKHRFVVLVGGGYDPSNDAMGFARDNKGNKIFMLDAASGNILWSAGPSGSGTIASPSFERMQHSFVADIRALDLSVDGYIDRIYTADLGGQVWRFDVKDGSAASALVIGGVMASVGGEEDADKDRRFYYAPDISEARCSGKVFYNVAIGSGDRENPVTDKDIQNTFFSFRDYLLRTPVETADYKSTCTAPVDGSVPEPCFETIVDDSSLVDATGTASPTIDGSATGWKLDLIQSAVDGEKSLAESRTFAGRIFFTTYSPENPPAGAGGGTPDGDVCGKKVGVNRLYVVNACNAAPVTNYASGTGEPLGVDDRSKILGQGSIAPEVVFVFPSPESDCTGRDCTPNPLCLVGLESCGRGAENRPVRTFWREQGAE